MHMTNCVSLWLVGIINKIEIIFKMCSGWKPHITGQISLNCIHPYISEDDRCIRTSGKTEVFYFFFLSSLLSFFFYFLIFFFFKNFHLYLLIS